MSCFLLYIYETPKEVNDELEFFRELPSGEQYLG